ncbi:MAG: WecB/TagA/CpsF family glycosyltransferase [Heyndrickxia sp.]
MLKYRKVMGLHFINTNMDQFVQELDTRLENAQRTFIVTANPEILMQTDTNHVYKEALKTADYLTPDGIGVIIASKILGQPIDERVTGFDLMQRLIALAEKKKYRIYFLGAEEEVIHTAVKRIQEKYPNIQMAGYHHGYFDQHDPSIVNAVKETNPDLVFVGLGVPKQELWIYENLQQFNKGIFIGVGGSFDVLAGKVKRAPKIWQKLNLEWFYRLLQQPTRWKRMLVLPLFLRRVIHIKLKK